MAYPNLAAELARHEITQEEVARAIGKTPETVSRWMTGKNGMPVEKIMEIRDKFFPTLSIDYLGDPEPHTPKPAAGDAA